jgi:hypothetical protein
LLTVEIRFLDPGAAPSRVVIHPGDQMRSKRELAGKPYADEDYALMHQAYLACRRLRLAPSDVPTSTGFDAWIDTVAEIEPRPTLKQVERLARMGEITRDAADALIEEIRVSGDPGESPTPRAE